MLGTALASWVIAGIVGIIAAAAASAIPREIHDGDLPYLTPEERYERQSQWVKVRQVTFTSAGWTYALVLGL